jgi:hypothetical protein
LALLKKPAAFGIDGDGNIAEVTVNALNAVRLFGHSQILAEGEEWRGALDQFVDKIGEMVAAMQVKGEKIEITTTPDEPKERTRAGFCRIDLRLKK